MLLFPDPSPPLLLSFLVNEFHFIIFTSSTMSSTTRNLPTQTLITNNMAEATTTQIAQALQLHTYGFPFETNPIFSDSHHVCYSILESMPVPQPTWSTTAPSVLRSPVPPVEEMEVFEWGDGQAGYAWWLGFLKGLDVDDSRKETEYSNAGMTQCQDGLEASEHCSFADEWLLIPITEDGGFLDSNCLGNDSASN